MLDRFVEELRAQGQPARIAVGPWRGARRRSKNVLELLAKPRKVLVYTKESRLHRGWWGLNPTQLREIQNSSQPWFVALLLTQRKSGYLIASATVEEHLGDPWHRAGDNDFKVHEGPELAAVEGPISYQDMSSRLIQFFRGAV